MATALAIITDAIRESNIIPVGQAPSTNHQNEGFTRLKALLASVYGSVPMRDWPVGTSEYYDAQNWNSADWIRVRPNSRIVYNVAEPTTLYLPENPQDGARIGLVDIGGNAATYPLTLNGNGRTIEAVKTLDVATDGVTREWIYRAELGDWVRISDLANIDAEVPFPAEFDDYFVTKLAMRLNPRYGRALTAESASRLQETGNQFAARYRQKRHVPADKGALQMNRVAPGRKVDPYNPSIDG